MNPVTNPRMNAINPRKIAVAASIFGCLTFLLFAAFLTDGPQEWIEAFVVAPIMSFVMLLFGILPFIAILRGQARSRSYAERMVFAVGAVTIAMIQLYAVLESVVWSTLQPKQESGWLLIIVPGVNLAVAMGIEFVSWLFRLANRSEPTETARDA